MRAADGKSAQLSVVDHRQGGDDRRQHDLSLVLGDSVERGCTPVKGSVGQIGTGRYLEQLESQLGWTTETARGVTELTRVVLGVVDQLFHRINGLRRIDDQDKLRG